MGNSGYDVTSYALDFYLDPSQAELSAAAELLIEVTYPALDRFSLDFAGFDITDLLVDEKPASFERVDQKLWINLPEPAYAGQKLSLHITYSGEPVVEPSPYVPFISHLGLYFPGGSIFTLSEPNGAHYWYPSNDHPRDKAAFRIKMSVPPEYTAVSIGSLVESGENPDSTRYFVWEHPTPVAPYLTMLAVGRYELLESQSPGGISLRHFVFPDLKDEFLMATTSTGEALDWISDLYGPYPFEAFGYVTTRLVSLASETQTMVILPETGLNEETVIHELAHMWFGDWVSLDSWADMWLKEGAAIYTYLLWQTRQDPAALDYFMQARTARLQADSSGYALGDLPKAQLLGTDTYWKGAALLHALRKQIGDEAFFDGMRLFLQRYGGQSASRQDFITVMEETSGQELGDFFDLWLFNR
jgi:aminopeptidase N